MKTPPPLGQWIKQRRAELDLTQESAADLIGCASNTLRTFELGIRRPSRTMAERLADALQIPAEQRSLFLRIARAPQASENGGTEATGHEPSAAVAAVPQVARRAALPALAGPLFGRDQERLSIATRLCSADCRLLTLLGPGGVGKTSLALQVSSDLAASDAFPDGVFWVNLAPVAADGVGVTIATVLNLAPAPDYPVDNLLAEALRNTKLLLVLDNLEHILEATPLLAYLLQAAPGLTLLATSRERLRLRGEWVVELGGLVAPAAGGQVATAPAAQLFLARAQQADGSFQLRPDHAEAVGQICRLVAGVPLGLELAAAWVPVLSCHEIASEIERSLDFLAASGPATDPRHQSLRAVFLHSWQLLNEREQQALARLSVLRGGGRRAAVEEIIGEGALLTLAGLVNKSLVRRVAHTSHTTRYELHELVRQYAAEQLANDAATLAEAQARHAAFHLDLLIQQTAAIQSGGIIAVWADLLPDIDNLRLAWEVACAQSRPAELSQAGHAVMSLWGTRGWNHESVAMFEQAVTVLRARSFSEADEPLRTVAVAHLLGLQAACLLVGGQFPQGRNLLHESVRLLEHDEQQLAASFALGFLGVALLYLGDHVGAQEVLNRNAALLATSPLPFLVGLNASYQGLASWFAGNYACARAVLEQALVVWQETPYPRGLAMTLLTQAWVALAEEQLDEATAIARRTLQVSVAARDSWGVGEALTTLGRVALMRGDLEEGRYLTQEGVDLAREYHDQWYIALRQARYGLLVARLDDREVARRALLEALQISQRGQMLPVTLIAALGLATLLATGPHAELALNLACCVASHPAADAETRRAASQLAAELVAQCPEMQPDESMLPEQSLASLLRKAMCNA